MVKQKENEMHPKLVTDLFDLYIRAYLWDVNEFKSNGSKISNMSYILLTDGVIAAQTISNGKNKIIIHSFLFDKTRHSFESAWKWLEANKTNILQINATEKNETIKINFLKITEISNDALSNLDNIALREIEIKLNKLWQISFKTDNLNRETIFNAYEILTDELKKQGITPDENDLSKITLTRLDLGCGNNKPDKYFGIDIKQFDKVDQIYDLNFGIPIMDNTQDVVNTSNFLEFIEPTNKIKIINEIHRILKPNGLFKFKVASTDGRGAFQNPYHKSYWNENSFLYFTGQVKINNDVPKFKVMKLKTLYDDRFKTATVIGYLKALK